MSIFAPKKVCLPTQLGACSHSTGRPPVPYWCTMFELLGHAAASPQAVWTPVGPRRAPGGSVQRIFIGGPQFRRPAAPIGAGRGYCKTAKVSPRCTIHLKAT